MDKVKALLDDLKPSDEFQQEIEKLLTDLTNQTTRFIRQADYPERGKFVLLTNVIANYVVNVLLQCTPPSDMYALTLNSFLTQETIAAVLAAKFHELSKTTTTRETH